MEQFAVIIDPKFAEILKYLLKKNELWDESRRIQHLKSKTKVALPIIVTSRSEQNLSECISGILQSSQTKDIVNLPFEIQALQLPLAKKHLLKTPKEILWMQVEELLTRKGMNTYTDFINEIPDHWEMHGDLVLLPCSAFRSTAWDSIGEELWHVVTSCLKCHRVARKSAISSDGFRTPQVSLLLGEDGWVEHIDNGIRYTYDVTKCMFSAGNITEKLRIASFDCRGQTVVDLYAGIGYFTLPYLVHANASHIHACEWNPDAVEALQRNLKLNNVVEKCTIHFGDNKQVCPIGCADRVNLGLIPSSEEGWPIACAALKPHIGGILHIHGNVTSFSSDSGHSLNDKGAGIENIDTIKQTAMNLSGSKVRNLYDCSANIHQPNRSIETNIGNVPLEPDCLAVMNEMSSKGYNSNKEFCVLDYEIPFKGDNYDKGNKKNNYWQVWAEETGTKIKALLERNHGKEWRTSIIHIEHIKSYAPHVDHLVLDLECRPFFLLTDDN
ncbi:hypothetical protein CHS0354_013152 [Potamilus streckersoni]|uniref:tRNA wybutosine-synthesizing protein 2 homolog n=1 Tax=Potamilus streckersoni TaxID=2493646 RepID=A0AAE0T865_9BIVA|nr:hypothetical protein CHS0354_013152 [Potamilus streckersoni]